jgi:hypothetical protein
MRIAVTAKSLKPEDSPVTYFLKNAPIPIRYTSLID